MSVLYMAALFRRGVLNFRKSVLESEQGEIIVDPLETQRMNKIAEY